MRFAQRTFSVGFENNVLKGGRGTATTAVPVAVLVAVNNSTDEAAGAEAIYQLWIHFFENKFSFSALDSCNKSTSEACVIHQISLGI